MKKSRIAHIFAQLIIVVGLASLAIEPAWPAGEPPDDVWAVSVDNDLFVPKHSSDRDFTGGLALTYSREDGARGWAPLDNGLSFFDKLAGHHIKGSQAPATSSIELGLYGFTPSEIDAVDLTPDDRPYASLAYLSASRLYAVRGGDKAISSSLTIGLLGLDAFESMQTRIHRATGTAEPQGWHNQISDGGELTARYQLALHDYWNLNTATSRFKTTYFSSVGYITEAGIALSTRQGLISSPDNRFNPELITYGERVNEALATPGQGTERFFWGGVAVKARLYNVFLQGQFRSNNHALNFEDLRPVILEAWLGYTFSLTDRTKISYVVRAQTSEIRSGAGDREHLWGGIVLSRS